MALMEITVGSRALSRNVAIKAIIPTDRINLPKKERSLAPLKSVYLLHGIFGNHTDWVAGTRIQALAEEKNIAIFMPDGENSFYLDDPVTGNFFSEFVGNELVNITREIFKLSDKREDTCIAGLSMGGYGAIRNGFKYCDNFGKIIGLSAALITYNAPNSPEESHWVYGTRGYYERVFGDLKKLPTSENDPEGIVKIVKSAGKALPKVYMACGTEDSLIDVNRRYRDFLIAEGVNLAYVEGPGAHTWKFWDTYIETALDWMLAM